MIPIYEQGTGKGIGHSSRTFQRRFLELCQDHVESSRAKAFAFIFYDFKDVEFRNVLRDHGVFTQLDRLAGDRLSIFFMHSGGRDAIHHFNAEFTNKLGLSTYVTLPCVVFFKLEEKQINNVGVVLLESANLIHGFHELYGVINKYIQDTIDDQPSDPKYIRWLQSSAHFISLEIFRAWLKSIIGS